MIPDKDMFMQMLRQPEKVAEALLHDLSVCAQNKQAFDKLVSLYEEGKAVDTAKALKACAKSLSHSNEVNMRLLMLLLTYVSGRNFSTDAATVLVKMGRGEEALREMFRQKMGGG